MGFALKEKFLSRHCCYLGAIEHESVAAKVSYHLVETSPPWMDELVSLVVRDVALQSAFRCEIYREDRFALVISDHDWLKTPNATVAQLFDRFVIPPSGRPNCHRAEVLLAAVCSGVMTIGVSGDFSRSLDGSELPPPLAAKTGLGARMLAWKL